MNNLGFAYLSALFATSKKSYIVFSFASSLSFAYIMEKVYKSIDAHDTMLSLSALFVIVFIIHVFMWIDFVTGVTASKKKGNVITSEKWGMTVSKCFGVFLYMIFSVFIMLMMPDNYIVLSIVFGPFTLTLLKEYISIGENLSVIYGSKSYMFTVVDKLFDLMELRFFKIFARHGDRIEKEIDEQIEKKKKDKTEETDETEKT